MCSWNLNRFFFCCFAMIQVSTNKTFEIKFFSRFFIMRMKHRNQSYRQHIQRANVIHFVSFQRFVHFVLHSMFLFFVSQNFRSRISFHFFLHFFLSSLVHISVEPKQQSKSILNFDSFIEQHFWLLVLFKTFLFFYKNTFLFHNLFHVRFFCTFFFDDSLNALKFFFSQFEHLFNWYTIFKNDRFNYTSTE